ncbi:MAG: PKD domain-containing protein [Bacteroidia bacterium]|nr:PKD domain-containing protein [Bacteroidia bacterium]
MKKLLIALGFIVSSVFTNAQQQQFKSIHQEELEFYNNLGFTTDSQWDEYFNYKYVPGEKSPQACPLNKIVFGWNPYWQTSQYNNFQWEQLSDFCWFSYEFSTSTGNPTNTHSWSTAAAVTAAINNGKRIHLCVTMFSDHATFFSSATAQNALIGNLIAALQQRNAIGVNIDFEAVPSAQKDNLTAFMKNLSEQVHNAISGSVISICLPAVDWSGTFDVTNMSNDATASKNVDWFIIMGYDYYYAGSSQAGPTDPLYSLTTGYNYNLTKTITYFLAKSVPPSQLILGLPYFGFDWPTASNTVVSNTSGSGNSKTYRAVRDNPSTYGTKLWNNTTYTPYYTYQDGSQWHQCWLSDEYAFGRRLDLVNQRAIGGIGLWALGYDDGYSEMWNTIKNKFTSCGTVACCDTIYDMGGPDRNYYDKENYTYTIQPTGASGLSLNFLSFDVEANYDTLWLYDGSSVNAPLIGSYTGTNNPGLVTATGNAVTLRFKSDNATNNPGWMAIWQCSVDNIPPVTSITAPAGWITSDFTASFTDTDNGSVEKSYYQALDYDGQHWGANTAHGFFADNFDTLEASVWTTFTGTWSSLNGNLHQGDSTVNNTNIFASLNQDLSNRYLYHFTARLESNAYGTNQRRFGLHFHCDTGNVLQRGNSYFIFFRQETNKLEFYKVTNSNPVQVKVVDNVVTNIGQWYDIKIIFDRITGKISVYRDDVFISSWTDTSPLTTPGNFVSFRTGHSKVSFGELKVFRSRNPSVSVSVGTANSDIRFQNPNPATHSAKIKSIVNDAVGNLSSIAYHDLDVDWSQPSAVSINDGTGNDIDETLLTTELAANWTNSVDPNSGLAEYKYAIGTTYGGADVAGWTSNGLNTSVTHNGLSLTVGTTCYFSVKSVNGAGLESLVSISDGQIVIQQAPLPVAGFSASPAQICVGDSVYFVNSSLHADAYQWTFTNGNPVSSSGINPAVYFDTSGIYPVQLIASGPGGVDTLTQNVNVIVNPLASASFTVNSTTGQIPFTALFTNTSQNATGYHWYFGDGATSSGTNPYHIYTDTGYYSVTLIALNSNCGNDTLVLTNYIHAVDLSGISALSSGNDYFETFPNPFHDAVNIKFRLNNTSKVTITLNNILGKEIAVLKDEEMKPGVHLQSIEINETILPDGFYFINYYIGNRLICVSKILKY